METSAACATRLIRYPHPSRSPSFSDQSHVDFYYRRASALPSLCLRPDFLRSLSSPGHHSTVRQSRCSSTLLEPVPELNSLMKELAELKLQIKQKKKQLKSQTKEEKERLKSQMKEEKKRLKSQMKEEKTAMKQKDCSEGKKKRCQSGSSSSSESSDEDCNTVSMRGLREERHLPCDSSVVSVSSTGEGEVVDTPIGGSDLTHSGIVEAMTVARSSSLLESFVTSNRLCCDGKMESLTSTRQENFGLSPKRCGVKVKFPITQAPNRIEVCAGGKCKKAGSEQLLAALSAQIPGSSNVVAVPCKCMGRCSTTMNVKVLKEDTNPQHHSHVRLEDASFILNRHYGLGHPPSGLPVLEPYDWEIPPVIIRCV